MASPRSSCVEHPKRSRYITIWDHYLYLFDQDYPAAALLASLELLCNWEMDKLSDEEPDEIPWFIADMAEITRSMLGMYSARTVQEAMKRIVDAGLVIVDRRGFGKSNRYLFRYDRVQLALRKRWVFDGNFAVEEWAENELLDGRVVGNFADSPSDHSFITKEKEKEYKQEPSQTPFQGPKEDLLPPPKSCTDLYGDMDSERFENISVENLNEWVYILFTQMQQKAPTPPSRKHQQTMVDRVADRGKEKVVEEIHAWFEAGNKSLDKLIASWKPSFGQRRGADTGGHSNGGYRKAVGRGEGNSNRPSSFMSQKQYSAEKPDPPLEAKAWNERVSSRQWEFWSSSLHQALLDRLADPDFVKSYDRILDKCADIAAKNHKMGQHITFSWLLKDDNWMRLVNGQYDYALKAEKAKRVEVDTSMEELIRKRKGESNESQNRRI